MSTARDKKLTEEQNQNWNSKGKLEDDKYFQIGVSDTTPIPLGSNTAANTTTTTPTVNTGNTEANTATTTPITTTPTANTGDTATNTTATTPTADTGFQYDAYQESDLVKQAQAMLQQQMTNKPGEYNSAWQGQLNDVIGQILNRDKFSYDLNADALYQQYVNQYLTQGKRAMMDTLGQAAAMTGGYGNSYAQSVGQQAYQGYLQQVNDMIPELYQLALQKYQMDGDALYDQYAMLGAQEEQDDGRHRDEMSDWQTELVRLQEQYNAERDYDYSKWSDGRDFAYGQYSDDRAYDYQAGRDKVADEQWQKEFDEAVRQFNFENKLGEFAKKKSSSSSSSTNRTNNNTNNNTQPNDTGSGKTDTSDWNAGQWESYFAQIRQTEGTAAAQKELNQKTSSGEIPKEYVAAASSGARGGKLGH